MNDINFDPVALTQALVQCPSVTPVDGGALQVTKDHFLRLHLLYLRHCHPTR
mgnify:CR=1 FL=1